MGPKRIRTPPPDAADRIVQMAYSIPYPPPGRHQLIWLRNIALVECLLCTGARVSELLRLRWEDLDGPRAIVLGKGSKERYIFFSRKAREALAAYPHDASGPVFRRHDKAGKGQAMTSTTARAIVRQLATQAEVLSFRFTPHSFRHNFAVNAIRRTGNLALVQDYLGHSSPMTTRVYAKIPLADLEAEHERLFAT